MRYYYAFVDDNGVLCVDAVAPYSQPEDRMQMMVGQHPDTIYFAVDNRVPDLRVPVSRNAHPTESEVTS